jgi:hypothetical protein
VKYPNLHEAYWVMNEELRAATGEHYGVVWQMVDDLWHYLMNEGDAPPAQRPESFRSMAELKKRFYPKDEEPEWFTCDYCKVGKVRVPVAPCPDCVDKVIGAE